MLRVLRTIGIGIGLLVAILVVLLLSYYLPGTQKVQVTGTEVKRIDVEAEAGGTRSRDVRFVVARSVDDDRTLVYRNEDTGWGWPPFFKFNSGDLMGEAVNLAQANDDGKVVLLQYYGWRLTWFDLYPNVLSLTKVDPDYQHVPVFNIVFILLTLGLVGFTWFNVRRMLRILTRRDENDSRASDDAKEA